MCLFHPSPEGIFLEVVVEARGSQTEGTWGEGTHTAATVSASRAAQLLQEGPDLTLHPQQLGLTPGIKGGSPVVFQIPQQQLQVAPDPAPIPAVEVPLDFTQDHGPVLGPAVPSVSDTTTRAPPSAALPKSRRAWRHSELSSLK